MSYNYDLKHLHTFVIYFKCIAVTQKKILLLKDLISTLKLLLVCFIDFVLSSIFSSFVLFLAYFDEF